MRGERDASPGPAESGPTVHPISRCLVVARVRLWGSTLLLRPRPLGLWSGGKDAASRRDLPRAGHGGPAGRGRVGLAVLALVASLAQGTEAPKVFAPALAHTNGLGMRFVPVPKTTVLFSVYETRVKDFRAFVRETGYVHLRETKDPNSRMWSLDRDGNKQRGHSWENPGFAQTEDHPVVGVNWYDAKAFCEWLTQRERAAGRLPANREYRLPRDHEWSVAVGLAEEDPARPPAEKDEQIKDRYPWGEWPEGQPPPMGAGNYAGAEVVDDKHWPINITTLDGYRDGYARTAPVGSFPPNALGIYDLGGNVWEWCDDLYKVGYQNRVVRGASWVNYVRDYLLSSCRSGGRPMVRYDNGGFRCVVGVSSP